MNQQTQFGCQNIIVLHLNTVYPSRDRLEDLILSFQFFPKTGDWCKSEISNSCDFVFSPTTQFDRWISDSASSHSLNCEPFKSVEITPNRTKGTKARIHPQPSHTIRQQTGKRIKQKTADNFRSPELLSIRLFSERLFITQEVCQPNELIAVSARFTRHLRVTVALCQSTNSRCTGIVLAGN